MPTGEQQVEGGKVEARAATEGIDAENTRAAGSYPPGFEPELEGEELRVAIVKEKGYRWLVWFEILFLLAIAALIIYFIVSSR